ncbi:MAG: uracil-DNA glycosylase [Alteraurantiacibacter sp.]
MDDAIPESWQPLLAPVLASAQRRSLPAFLDAEEAAGKKIYPPAGQRFRALELTPPDAVKAVILGQDPYHGPGQAHGLAFSVPFGEKLPPSLRNIFRELQDDLGLTPPPQGNLESWAKQGVLLLNSALSVEAGRAGSHAKRGWEGVTDAVMAAVAECETPTAFVLWGAHAQDKAARIPAMRAPRHLVIESPHPSPLSAHRGFFGSQPFSRTNSFLESAGRRGIDWSL